MRSLWVGLSSSTLFAGCGDKALLPGDTTAFVAEDADGDGHAAVSFGGSDCDDTDPSISPDIDELCDGIDNDCDGEIDEDVLSTFYVDSDGDGFGDPGNPTSACARPKGTVSDRSDCDDTDAMTFPGAGEVCDDADNDCDSEVDEDIKLTFYVDRDRDGYGDTDTITEACTRPSGHAEKGGDCDDNSRQTYPGALELCDQADNDCDTDIDEDAIDASVWHRDSDKDGYGDPKNTADACSPPSGYVLDDSDCDDATPGTHPGADEYCDELDNDCDDSVDEDAIDETTWFIDYDGDGYGSERYTLTQCTQPTGYVRGSTDCDDADDSVSPGAAEYCDGFDTNCDGIDDNDDAEDASSWHADADEDGFGDPDNTMTACSQPEGYTTDQSDCDDTSATAYPGSTETEVPFDGIDIDCDGNDFCTDLSCDGQPDLVQGVYYTGSSHFTQTRIHINTGTNFTDADLITIPSTGTYEVLNADLDQNGYQDLVLASYTDGSGFATDSFVYYGSASGYSTADRDSLPTLGSLHAAINDLNADGYSDIIFANHFDGRSYSVDSYVYYGSATGYSTADRDSLPGHGSRRVRTADLNSDSYPDLVLCNYQDPDWETDSYVYYGSISGFSATADEALPTQGCRDVQVSDLDQDGYEDLIFANYYDGSQFKIDSYIYYGSATGYSTADRDSLPTIGTASAAVVDFDQDGRDDVVFGGYFSGSWGDTAVTTVYYNTATGFSSSSTDSISANGVWAVRGEDLNDDGYPELILPRLYSGRSYTTDSYVLYGSATGFTRTVSVPTIGASKVAIGDLDGDDMPELIFNNYNSGSWADPPDTYIYYGSLSGYSTAERDDLTTAGSWATPLLVGDTSWSP